MNIKDIAKLCGVSPSTVSKILHNKDEEISSETRKRVLDIIKEYQYIPYSKVIRNAAIKNHLIGVLISEESHFAKALLYEIERAAMSEGYSIILCNTQGMLEKAEKYISILEGKGVEGTVAVDQPPAVLKRLELPGVAVSESNNASGHHNLQELLYDMEDAGRLVTEYLLEKEHTRIGCLLTAADAAVEAGYIKTLQHHGINPNPLYICRAGEDEEISATELSQCLEADITAVIVSSSALAARIYAWLQERGQAVLDSLSVISIREDELAGFLNPGLTTVQLPVRELGKSVITDLLKSIENRQQPQEMSSKLHFSLIDRASVRTPATKRQGSKLVVVGSMNMDCIVSVSHIPANGETVLSRNIAMIPGGKGANQAFAAGRLGGRVYMIGCLGSDNDSKKIYENLLNSGVKLDGVVFDPTMPTGKAFINVPSDGKSTIIVYPGANHQLDPGKIRKFRYLLDNAGFCLISLEILVDTAKYVMKECRKRKVQTILKPSATEVLEDEIYAMTDYFVPNEKEIHQLIPGQQSLEEKADTLLEKGVRNVLITLGAGGCYFKSREFESYYPAVDFNPVDTTGAADAFISALAVALSEESDITYAIGFATFYAGISITRSGVQPAMTDRRGVEIYNNDIVKFFFKRVYRKPSSQIPLA